MTSNKAMTEILQRINFRTQNGCHNCEHGYDGREGDYNAGYQWVPLCDQHNYIAPNHAICDLWIERKGERREDPNGNTGD